MFIFVFFFFFFFFQAEDGIRDHCVTGVQTCALPILFGVVLGDVDEGDRGGDPDHAAQREVPPGGGVSGGIEQRSEERRVGKECRSRGWRYEYKKKRKD